MSRQNRNKDNLDLVVLSMLELRLKEILEGKKDINVLLQTYLSTIFSNSLITANGLPSETTQKISDTIGKINEQFYYKFFMLNNKTLEKNMFLGFLVEGLWEFGLGRKPAISELEKWLKTLGMKGVGHTTIRDANALFRTHNEAWFKRTKNNLNEFLKINKTEIVRENLIRLIFNIPVDEESLNKFFSISDQFKHGHVKSHMALKKFKEFIALILEAHAKQRALLKHFKK